MTLNELELKLLEVIDQFAHLFDSLKIGDYNILTWLWWLITQLGGSIAIILVLVIIYWCINKEKGEKIAFSIITSFCINGVLKGLFNRTRPFEINEKIRKLPLSMDGATGSSFPSGHSQNSLTFYTSIAFHNRSKATLIIAIIMGILIPFSRLYLGVHYPSDVIIGGIVGILIAYVTFIGLKYYYHKKYLFYIGLIIFSLPFLFLPNAPKDLFKGVGLLIGFVIGIFIENKAIKFTTDVSFSHKLLRLIIGLIIVGVIYLVYHFVGDLIEVFEITILTNLFAMGMHMIMSLSIFGLIPFMFKRENGKLWI